MAVHGFVAALEATPNLPVGKVSFLVIAPAGEVIGTGQEVAEALDTEFVSVGKVLELDAG